MDGGGIKNFEGELLAARIKEMDAHMKKIKEANSRMRKEIAVRNEDWKGNELAEFLTAIELVAKHPQDSVLQAKTRRICILHRYCTECAVLLRDDIEINSASALGSMEMLPADF